MQDEQSNANRIMSRRVGSALEAAVRVAAELGTTELVIDASMFTALRSELPYSEDDRYYSAARQNAFVWKGITLRKGLLP